MMMIVEIKIVTRGRIMCSRQRADTAINLILDDNTLNDFARGNLAISYILGNKEKTISSPDVKLGDLAYDNSVHLIIKQLIN